MIKVVFCLRRLSHLTANEFYEYWLNEHAPLVRQHAAALRIKRYVQSHGLDQPLLQPTIEVRGGQVPAYDGVAELWWDSLDDLLAAGKSEESRQAGRALLVDERKFIDLKNSPMFYTQEHIIIP